MFCNDQNCFKFLNLLYAKKELKEIEYMKYGDIGRAFP